MQSINGLSAIAGSYDAFILDLWGVIHDGTQLYPGVHEALTQLRGAGKKIIMLSNAPRRARKVEKVLNQLGIEPALYDMVLSSGEAGYQWLAQQNAPLGVRYFYVGPDKDTDVMDGLGYTRCMELRDAQFLLNVGFGSDEPIPDEHAPALQEAKSLGLPMLCLNPDLEVVKITGGRFACAGVLARQYAAMGGEVVWFGKPYAAVYEQCLRALAPVEKGRIVAIGDSLDTDIPGALGFGIDCVLIMGGILKDKTAAELKDLCRSLALEPNYIAPRLTW
jgi:HAD superfamily hydrolase (TIGR01459 family)